MSVTAVRARSQSASRIVARHAVRWATGGPAQRRLLWREYVFRGLRHFTSAVAVDGADGLRYFVSTDDLAIGRTVFATGEYGRRDLALAVELTATHRAATPATLTRQVFVDVGANIGTTSLPALASHGFQSVVAIEPAETNVRLLELNAVANHLADRISIVRAAASSFDGSVTLELSPTNWGDHRVRTSTVGDGAFGEARRETVEVPSRRLDSILADQHVAPSEIGLVWIDVQGHEAQVLEGATEVLRASVPLVLEYWPYGLHRSGSTTDVIGLLSDAYTHYVDLGDSGAGKGATLLLAPIAGLTALAGAVTGIDHTNLLVFNALGNDT